MIAIGYTVMRLQLWQEIDVYVDGAAAVAGNDIYGDGTIAVAGIKEEIAK